MRAIVLPLLLTLGGLSAPAQESPFPKPTSHHLAMKELAGTWDAVVKMYMDPAKPPMESKGTETNTLVAGGLWIKSEIRSEMMGMPFEGYGLFGYDTLAKAHVGSWVDSSGTWMAVTKGTCTKDCREQTTFFEGFDEAGKPMTFKEVHTQPDADHRAMVMFAKGKSGAYLKIMEIAYTRRK
jgi:hypothetical protein